MRRKLTVLLVMLLGVLAPAMIRFRAAAQQGGTTYYVYDSNGRLSVVIAPSGAAAIYQYDAAGNFTSISQVPATTFQVYGFTPASGGAGDQVTVFGTGFGAGSGITAVSFNGTAAPVVNSTANSVVTTVPSGATTGPISVTNSTGTATSATSFAIVSQITIIPGAATLLVGQNVQFTALDSVPGDTGVTWSVNGVKGGNSTVGTVSTSGLYTAPSQPSNSIVVAATSQVNPAAVASAQVTVVSASQISHLYYQVSVQVGFFAGSGKLPFQAPSVSVQLGQYIGGAVADYSAAVSVTTGPVVTGVSPSTLTPGQSGTSFTLTGQNLAGVTSIYFIGPNGIDTSITASSVSASTSGTSVTATVATGNGATAGQHTVVVVAGSLMSTLAPFANGSNTVQVK
ncbi:MAG TPA: IPT/TIG domain-containing protein [Blastocatellia bacterium]